MPDDRLKRLFESVTLENGNGSHPLGTKCHVHGSRSKIEIHRGPNAKDCGLKCLQLDRGVRACASNTKYVGSAWARAFGNFLVIAQVSL